MMDMKGATGKYVQEQRTYQLEKINHEISFSVDSDEDHPLVNASFIIKNWNSNMPAGLSLNGKLTPIKQGIFRDTDGTKTLAIWVEVIETEKTEFVIKLE